MIVLLLQIYTENWVNSPGQEEDNSWQAFVYVPKGNWYIAKASSETFSCNDSHIISDSRKHACYFNFEGSFKLTENMHDV